jgi:AmiR/NasT family two-component response regulator
VSVARIEANGQDWGELRLRFSLEQTEVASPVKLARYLAQQIASAIHNAELASSNRTLAKGLAELKDEVATRKILERAKGVLAETQNLAPARAEALLKRHSERTGRSLREISEAVRTLQKSGFSVPLQRIA